MISECITFPVQLNILYVCVMKICHGNPAASDVHWIINFSKVVQVSSTYEFKPTNCYMQSELCYIGGWPENFPAPSEFWQLAHLWVAAR